MRLQSLSARIVGYVAIPGVGTFNAAKACALAWVRGLKGAPNWRVDLQNEQGETVWTWEVDKHE